MTEYWELWQRDPETWHALSEKIASGVVAVLQRMSLDHADIRLNRWDLPGVEVLFPPGSLAADADGVYRIIHVYTRVQPTQAVIVLGAGAWFDEQGPLPQEPWTRWWCHSSRQAELEWESRLEDVEDVTQDVDNRFATTLAVTRQWQWFYDDRRWQGEMMIPEEPVRYSSVNPGHRAE